MANNNDTGYTQGSNSIWGATNPLNDSPDTLLYGVGAPYVGIFDREDKPIIDPESGLSLGELCESFSYESVEEGVDSARFVIHCSNPNILNLKSLQYRANVNLQWGYIPPNPREYTKNNPPFSRVKTMTITKRNIVFNDNGVTVTIELKDPHYFLFLTNPSYIGMGAATPNNLTKFLMDMRNGGVKGVIVGYNYYGTKLTKTTVGFGIPISEEEVRESGNIVTQPIEDFNEEHYGMFGNPVNNVRLDHALQDKDGNLLTSSVALKKEITPEKLGDGPIEDSPLYKELKAFADEQGLTEVRYQETRSGVQFLYTGSLKGEGSKWQQYENDINAALPNGKYYLHGDGSGELKFQNDVISDAYKVYTWAGGNGELLSFEVEDDFSITQTQVNKSQDIDADKQLNSKTNTQLDGNPKDKVVHLLNNPGKTWESGETGSTYMATPGVYVQSRYGDPNSGASKWLANNVIDPVVGFFSGLFSDKPKKSYRDLAIDAAKHHIQNREFIENIESSTSPKFYTYNLTEAYTNPNALHRSQAPALDSRALGYWCPTPTDDQVEEFIRNATKAWTELVSKQKFDANSPDELVKKNWENMMKLQYYDIVKEVVVFGSTDVEGHTRGYYDQLESLIAAGGPSNYFTTGLITGNPYHFEGEGWSAQVLDVTRETSQESQGYKFNTYKLKIKYSLNGEKVMTALDPESGDISLFNDLTRITTHKMEARATTIGDPLMEATMNIDIQGVGPYSRRWYVTKITHELSPQRGYICNIEFKPYEITNKQLMISGKAATQNWLVGLKKAYEKVNKENPGQVQENAFNYWDNIKGEFKCWVNNFTLDELKNIIKVQGKTKDDEGNEVGVVTNISNQANVLITEVQAETYSESSKKSLPKNQGKNNQQDK